MRGCYRTVFALVAAFLWVGLSGTDMHAQVHMRDSSPQELGVVQIATGDGHTCVLTNAGDIRCWGFNSTGQLGNDSLDDSNMPVAVVDLMSGVQTIVTGGAHTCALTAAEGIKCWGWNARGQLGDGTAATRSTPVDVEGLDSGVQAIATGGAHTCALAAAGAVKCWGYNTFGQLGDGSTADKLTPVDVDGLDSGVQAIATGGNHTCALTAAESIKCWGWNTYGQLGDGSTADKHTPVDVEGLDSGVQAIAMGRYHTCALTAAGAVKCWGWNTYGQLGDGSTTDKHTPVDVEGLDSGVQAIATGGNHTCALTAAGAVKCWGYNTFGQLGDGSTTDKHTPVDVEGLDSGVQAIAMGRHHTCAVISAESIKCWGWNTYGQLGDGSTADKHTPVDVNGLFVSEQTGMIFVPALTR